MLEHVRDTYKRLRLICVDGGYAGKLIDWVRDRRRRGKVTLEIVKRTDDMKGFKLLPHKWVVERTFGWLGRHRRFSKDYELLAESSEAMVHIVMIGLMARRLALARRVL